MTRQRWPDAILIYNDYFNLEYENETNWTLDLIAALKNAGAPVDAIGCEAHAAWQMSPDTLRNNIDRIAATGLPVYISGTGIEQSDDALQDSCMRTIFPVFWNHPKVVGITFWGYVVGATWREGIGLLSDEGVERPALTWLMNYVKDHPDPPNDFPGFLTGGTSVTLPRSGCGITVNHRGHPDVTGIYNLLGRSAGGHTLNGTPVYTGKHRPAAGWYVTGKGGHLGTSVVPR